MGIWWRELVTDSRALVTCRRVGWSRSCAGRAAALGAAATLRKIGRRQLVLVGAAHPPASPRAVGKAGQSPNTLCC